MIDFISSIKTNSGLEIARGSVLSLPKESAEKLVVKEIVADAGYVELVVAVNNDDYNTRKINLEKFE